MRKNTDLEKIKQIATGLLLLDIEEDAFPFIVHHPFANSPHFLINGEILNIKDNRPLWDSYMKEKIQSVSKYIQFAYMIQNPYKPLFLKLTKDYINAEDLSLFLRDTWLSCETVNCDPNLRKSGFVTLFRKSNPHVLMTEEERTVLAGLPEELVVYRGISFLTNHPVRGMSWTTNMDRALWFARRYEEKSDFQSNGRVYETKIKREDVLAYFSAEEETVINYKNIGTVRKVI